MRSICSVEGCKNEVTGQGLCRKHYSRERANGTLPGKPCSIDGCPRTVAANGMCHLHFRRTKRGTDLHAKVREVNPGRTCKSIGCNLPFVAKGFCGAHYARHRKGQDTTSAVKKWTRSSKLKNTQGYMMIRNPKHPNANGMGYVLEHRMVMANALGRPLLSHENVHHKNGDRTDNRLKKEHAFHCPSGCCNLELWSKSQPCGQRVRDRLAWAKEILDTYGHWI
jgi:hypothetical protein